MSIVEITEEEKQTEEDKKEQAVMSANLNTIKEAMSTALLINDTKWQEELQSAYQKALNNETKKAYELTKCKYCGGELTEKHDQKWCTNCALGQLDLKIYEEENGLTEDEKQEEK